MALKTYYFHQLYKYYSVADKPICDFVLLMDKLQKNLQKVLKNIK